MGTGNEAFYSDRQRKWFFANLGSIYNVFRESMPGVPEFEEMRDRILDSFAAIDKMSDLAEQLYRQYSEMEAEVQLKEAAQLRQEVAAEIAEAVRKATDSGKDEKQIEKIKNSFDSRLKTKVKRRVKAYESVGRCNGFIKRLLDEAGIKYEKSDLTGLYEESSVSKYDNDINNDVSIDFDGAVDNAIIRGSIVFIKGDGTGGKHVLFINKKTKNGYEVIHAAGRNKGIIKDEWSKKYFKKAFLRVWNPALFRLPEKTNPEE